MAAVMFGEEIHPDRVIQVDKLYEIFNKYEIPYSFPAQHGIESNAFAVVRCKDCKHYWKNVNTPGFDGKCTTVGDDDFCSDGERKDNDDGNSQRNDL